MPSEFARIVNGFDNEEALRGTAMVLTVTGLSELFGLEEAHDEAEDAAQAAGA